MQPSGEYCTCGVFCRLYFVMFTHLGAIFMGKTDHQNSCCNSEKPTFAVFNHMPSDYCRCLSHPYSNNCSNKLRRIFARPRDELPSVWHSLHSLYAAMESGRGVCHFGSCLWFPAVCNCCHCCNFPKHCRRPARIYSAVKTDPRLLHFL